MEKEQGGLVAQRGWGEELSEKLTSSCHQFHSAQDLYADYERETGEMNSERRAVKPLHGGFRLGRRTEDNLFMLERLAELARVRGDKI